jgi:hypothetical protein
MPEASFFDLAEGVGLSKAALWLWSEIPLKRDFNPCA